MNETPEATAIFAPIWKRKWLILIVAILAGAGSYFYYRRDPSIYSASTQLYLGNGAEDRRRLEARRRRWRGRWWWRQEGQRSERIHAGFADRLEHHQVDGSRAPAQTAQKRRRARRAEG